MTDLKKPRGYQEDFDPVWYLESYQSSVQGNPEEGDMLRFFVDSLHSIFCSGSIRGDKLLDIGTGPTVYSVISASRHVAEIHLSDLVDKNREVLQKYLDGAPNVTALFEYIIGKENDGTPLERRVNALRKKVTQIYEIDILKSKLVEDLSSTYDIITSCLCLEAAATSIEEYAKSIAKIRNMLNPGGHLVLVGVLSQNFYRVGDFRFDCLKIGSDDIKNIIRNSGFEINVWQETLNENYNPHAESKEFSDFEGAFVMDAQKN